MGVEWDQRAIFSNHPQPLFLEAQPDDREISDENFRFHSGDRDYSMRVYPRMFGRIMYQNYYSIWHHHAYYHLILVSSGRCCLDTGPHSSQLLETNSLILLNPCTPHRFRHVGREPFEHAAVLWALAEAGSPRTDIANPFPFQKLYRPDWHHAVDLCRLTRAEADDFLFRHRQLRRLLDLPEKAVRIIPVLFAFIMEEMRLLIDQTEMELRSKQETPLLTRVALLVDDHLAQPDFGLAQIAAAFERTPHHLSRRFQEETGFSLPEYLRRRRLEQARRLLLSTTLPITEIATRCGFTSSGYFSRLFHQRFQFTPVAYRKLTGVVPGPIQIDSMTDIQTLRYQGKLPEIEG